MTTINKGDRVRLIRLDGTITDEVYTVHDRWGDNTSPRNASFWHANCEHYTHTDLMRHADDTSPVAVPYGGTWYIARGNNMGWGRSTSINNAVRNMHAQGGRATDYTVHQCTKWTFVDGMGSLSYPSGIDPVEVKRITSKRKTA